MTYADNSVYKGEWKDDLRNGEGKMTYADNSVYVGEWKDDLRNGVGKMTYADNSVYVGYWKDDQRKGKGKMTYTNGDVYEDVWKDEFLPIKLKQETECLVCTEHKLDLLIMRCCGKLICPDCKTKYEKHNINKRCPYCYQNYGDVKAYNFFEKNLNHFIINNKSDGNRKKLLISKKRSMKRSKKRSMKRSKKRSMKRSKKRSIKKSKKRSIQRSKKRSITAVYFRMGH